MHKTVAHTVGGRGRTRFPPVIGEEDGDAGGEDVGGDVDGDGEVEEGRLARVGVLAAEAELGGAVDNL